MRMVAHKLAHTLMKIFILEEAPNFFIIRKIN